MTNERSIEKLAAHFNSYALKVYADNSPLYARLAAGAAEDVELLTLANHAPLGQPVANLLFGAVHYLLLKGTPHSLAAFYPDLSTHPIQDREPYPEFRAFCLEHAATIEHLLTTHRVQTNEVRRCACLLPAFELVARRTGRRPLFLVEIGPSAGLNLLWDDYGYAYSSGREGWRYCGNLDSPVQLSCTLRGDFLPPLPETMPQVGDRIGIDLSPIDVRDTEAIDWLRALLWPEQKHRAELFERAVQVAKAHPPRLIAGDAVELLPGILANVPRDAVPVLFHSFAITQFSTEMRALLSEQFLAASRERPLYRLSIEWPREVELPQLSVSAYNQGMVAEQQLAQCDQHGAWLEWLGIESNGNN